jgi:hypothetical protein
MHAVRNEEKYPSRGAVFSLAFPKTTSSQRFEGYAHILMKAGQAEFLPGKFDSKIPDFARQGL